MSKLQIDLSPYLEYLQEMPYYPYSAVGAGALILLLPLLLLFARRGRTTKRPAARSSRTTAPIVSARAIDGLSSSGEADASFSAHATSAPFKPATPPPAAPASRPVTVPPVASTPPIAQSHTATAQQHPVPPQAAPPPAPAPVAPRPSVAPTSANKGLHDKFQELYFELYFELGLSTDFEDVRTTVEARLNSVSAGAAAPDVAVLQQLAEVVEEMLKSGKNHVGKGVLGTHGQELFGVYRYALRTLQAKGQASQIESKLDALEQQMRLLG